MGAVVVTRRLEPALSGLRGDGLLHLRQEDGTHTLCGTRTSQGLQRDDARRSWPVCPTCEQIRVERAESESSASTGLTGRDS